jgi:hypothetical protein
LCLFDITEANNPRKLEEEIKATPQTPAQGWFSLVNLLLYLYLYLVCLLIIVA